MKKRINQILISQEPPELHNVLWLNPSDKNLYMWTNGDWAPITIEPNLVDVNIDALKTQNKNVISAINEIYDLIIPNKQHKFHSYDMLDMYIPATSYGYCKPLVTVTPGTYLCHAHKLAVVDNTIYNDVCIIAVSPQSELLTQDNILINMLNQYKDDILGYSSLDQEITATENAILLLVPVSTDTLEQILNDMEIPTYDSSMHILAHYVIVVPSESYMAYYLREIITLHNDIKILSNSTNE